MQAGFDIWSIVAVGWAWFYSWFILVDKLIESVLNEGIVHYFYCSVIIVVVNTVKLQGMLVMNCIFCIKIHIQTTIKCINVGIVVLLSSYILTKYSSIQQLN